MSIFDDPQILASLTEGQLKALRNYEQAHLAQMQADKDRAQQAQFRKLNPLITSPLGQAVATGPTPRLSSLGSNSAGTQPWKPWQPDPQLFATLIARHQDRVARWTDAGKDLAHLSERTIGDALIMLAFAHADTYASYPSDPAARIPLLIEAAERLSGLIPASRILASYRQDMLNQPALLPPGCGLAAKILDLPTGKYPTLISRLLHMANNITKDDRILNALAVIDTASSVEDRRRIATHQLRQLTGNRPTFTMLDLLAIADEPTHVLNLRSSTDRLLASIASADDLIANPD
jgi:hypothetical protein